MGTHPLGSYRSVSAGQTQLHCHRRNSTWQSQSPNLHCLRLEDKYETPVNKSSVGCVHHLYVLLSNLFLPDSHCQYQHSIHTEDHHKRRCLGRVSGGCLHCQLGDCRCPLPDTTPEPDQPTPAILGTSSFLYWRLKF